MDEEVDSQYAEEKARSGEALSEPPMVAEPSAAGARITAHPPAPASGPISDERDARTGSGAPSV
jgi:hypothetical protein